MNMEQGALSSAELALNGTADGARCLRLASFNIQTGIRTGAFHHYLTGGWQHLLPTPARAANLSRIAQLLRPFDIVGLQEVDGGGARSRFVVQTQYLAEHGHYAYWHNQINRRVGWLALHSNGLLSRYKPTRIEEFPLPGLPGRGAILAHYGDDPKHAFCVCVAHLALSRRGRLRQIDFLCELLAPLPYAVLMGDLNCEPHSQELTLLENKGGFVNPMRGVKSFPSWRPHRLLDYILVKPDLPVKNVRVLDFACSDHLPIALDMGLPANVAIAV
ncbi:EEP domain-containing protein [Methylogaea oryzae]|uniref:EEP domain-containing protein n=2 Tax=Methylogaea oryzae TaxID=1295382 RepID=A0A8D5AID7_9GAMM|nr:EEP domain-containing protein [Methylogaea oryzae]